MGVTTEVPGPKRGPEDEGSGNRRARRGTSQEAPERLGPDPAGPGQGAGRRGGGARRGHGGARTSCVWGGGLGGQGVVGGQGGGS